jgi:hypothetical protein
MRTLTAVALLFCAASIAAAQPGDSSLLGFVGFAPAGSEVLIGINVARFLQSDLGKRATAELAKPENAGFRVLLEMAGFNPLHDVDEVLDAESSKQKFCLMRGRFDARMLSRLAAAGGMDLVDYHGVQIVTIRGGQLDGLARAVVSPSILVGGDEATVREFIDRPGRGVGLAADVAARARELAKANDIWVLLDAPLSTILPQGANPGHAGRLIDSIERASLGIKFGADVAVWARAVTRTPQDAQTLVSAIGFVSAMVAATQQGNTQLAALLKKLKVEAEGNTTSVSLAMSEPEAEAAIEYAIDARIAARPVQRTAGPLKIVDTHLNLKVEASAGQLLLSWNRDAPLISAATRGTLIIHDGNHTEEVDLDLSTLRTGSVRYSPVSKDVSFRLEVTDQKSGTSQVETVRWPAPKQ